jgi:hypothetical protein
MGHDTIMADIPDSVIDQHLGKTELDHSGASPFQCFP